LGTISGFQALGWAVERFIVGDRLPAAVSGKSEQFLTAGQWRLLLADFVRLALSAVNAWRAHRELRGRVDWVYERFAALQSLGWIFQRGGVPWILETNGPFFYEARTDRKSLMLSAVARRLEMRAYRACDVLVCVSEALKQIVLRESGIPPSKVVVLPNGVDSDFLAPGREVPRRFCAGFTVGYVGSLIAWQGIDLLLRALRVIRDDDGVTMSAVIVGDGPARDAWVTLAAELGLSDAAIFAGRVSRDDLPSVLEGFDVGFAGHYGANGSAVYHSPLKLYEYMAMGKPPVASAVEDARHLIRDNATGFLFPPANLAGLVDALRRAYAARDRLPSMGRQAREEVVARHSWAARVRTLIAEVEQRLATP
jgi:glycosyltransferase involved in cell wall biosynthesis